MTEFTSLFWFRRDLRLEDNHGLYKALKSGLPVIPIFIFDKDILDGLPSNDKRLSFIYGRIWKLKQDLKQIDKNLLVYYGRPNEIFKYILSEHKIRAVFTNHDYEPYAIQRDLEIKKLLSNYDIAFHTFKDQVIFEKKEILTQAGQPYTVFTPYSRKWREKLSAKDVAGYHSEELLDKIKSGLNEKFPNLNDMGFEHVDFSIVDSTIPADLVKKYDKIRNTPSISTTKLGIHLRFGTMSIRNLVRRALDLNETWLNELVWREFFMMILSNFPYVVERSFKEKYDSIKWIDDEDAFKKWCMGKTGYPLVDAGMRELNATGFMHNRVRMVTASFLCKHLLINWRKGEQYFAEKLLDFELASNNGNWQWAAGSGCDAAPYFRVFNPLIQQEKFDPDFKYIKKWLPEFGTSKYPKPIVDHKFARERAIATYKDALN